MAKIHKAGNTAYVSLYSEETQIQVTLVMHSVRTDAQLNKAVTAWLKTAHPSLAEGLQVTSVTYFLYEILKQHVDRVFEIDTPTKAKAAVAGK
jgi:threonine dehydratase